METPAARAAEKKDKMEGNLFSDLGKKPSETRGKPVCGQPSLLGNPSLGVAQRRGAAKYTFQRKVVAPGADATPAR